MKTIALTKGEVTYVDDADFEWLNQWKWTCYTAQDGAKSAARNVKGKTVYMHRLIMGFPARLEVDHENLNRLDNQRHNLRVATRSQNAANRRLQSNNSLGYRGLAYDKRDGRWYAWIKSQGQRISLKGHATKEEAALAYDVAAIQIYGEFATLNILDGFGL